MSVSLPLLPLQSAPLTGTGAVALTPGVAGDSSAAGSTPIVPLQGFMELMGEAQGAAGASVAAQAGTAVALPPPSLPSAMAESPSTVVAGTIKTAVAVPGPVSQAAAQALYAVAPRGIVFSGIEEIQPVGLEISEPDTVETVNLPVDTPVLTRTPMPPSQPAARTGFSKTAASSEGAGLPQGLGSDTSTGPAFSPVDAPAAAQKAGEQGSPVLEKAPVDRLVALPRAEATRFTESVTAAEKTDETTRLPEDKSVPARPVAASLPPATAKASQGAATLPSAKAVVSAEDSLSTLETAPIVQNPVPQNESAAGQVAQTDASPASSSFGRTSANGVVASVALPIEPETRATDAPEQSPLCSPEAAPEAETITSSRQGSLSDKIVHEGSANKASPGQARRLYSRESKAPQAAYRPIETSAPLRSADSAVILTKGEGEQLPEQSSVAPSDDRQDAVTLPLTASASASVIQPATLLPVPVTPMPESAPQTASRSVADESVANDVTASDPVKPSSACVHDAPATVANDVTVSDPAKPLSACVHDAPATVANDVTVSDLEKGGGEALFAGHPGRSSDVSVFPGKATQPAPMNQKQVLPVSGEAIAEAKDPIETAQAPSLQRIQPSQITGAPAQGHSPAAEPEETPAAMEQAPMDSVKRTVSTAKSAKPGLQTPNPTQVLVDAGSPDDAEAPEALAAEEGPLMTAVPSVASVRSAKQSKGPSTAAEPSDRGPLASSTNSLPSTPFQATRQPETVSDENAVPVVAPKRSSSHKVHLEKAEAAVPPISSLGVSIPSVPQASEPAKAPASIELRVSPGSIAMPATASALSLLSADIAPDVDAEARAVIQEAFRNTGLSLVSSMSGPERKPEAPVMDKAATVSPETSQETQVPTTVFEVSVRDARQLEFRPSVQVSQWGRPGPVQELPKTPEASPAVSNPSVPVSTSVEIPFSAAVALPVGPLASAGLASVSPALPKESAKTAAAPSRKEGVILNAKGKAEKNTPQTPDVQGKTEGKKAAGIATAEKVPVMFSDESIKTTQRESQETLPAASLGLDRADRIEPSKSVSSSNRGSEATDLPRDPVVKDTALRTLDIVREVTEKLQGRTQRVLNFDMNLEGGERLSVCLEIRHGEIRTTFRTDSSELREALSREWQTSMPATLQGVEPVKLSDPNFSSTSHGRSDTGLMNADGQAARQQQQQTQQQHASQHASNGSSSLQKPARAQDESAREQTVPTRNSAMDGNQRLHAFA